MADRELEEDFSLEEKAVTATENGISILVLESDEAG